ncbi:MAG: hypothetical protein MJA82_04650 [Clostridia bacterium]|nr:hypothetical protein [Clostridia bacterium]
MKKKILIILFLSILLIGCIRNKNDSVINNNLQKGEKINHQFIDLSSVEPSIIFKGKTQDESKVFYSYEYAMKYNEKASKSLIEISISNKPYIEHISNDKKKILIKQYEIKYWFTGSIVHFIGNIDNKNMYIKGDIVKPLNYEKYLKIVEACIDYIEKNY